MLNASSDIDVGEILGNSLVSRLNTSSHSERVLPRRSEPTKPNDPGNDWTLGKAFLARILKPAKFDRLEKPRKSRYLRRKVRLALANLDD